jgi:hypothetical protein
VAVTIDRHHLFEVMAISRVALARVRYSQASLTSSCSRRLNAPRARIGRGCSLLRPLRAGMPRRGAAELRR